MFSPHWIPVPDIICLVHLFPARTLYSWQCGVDPSGGQREGGGRQAGWGRWKEGAKNKGLVRRDAAAQPGYWQAGAAIHSDVSAERKKFSRGQRGEGSGCNAGIEWVELKLCLGARTHQTRTQQARREWKMNHFYIHSVSTYSPEVFSVLIKWLF